MFTSARLILTKLQSQLDPGTVDAILFLHKNYVQGQNELCIEREDLDELLSMLDEDGREAAASPDVDTPDIPDAPPPPPP